ncbi:hypothetical protein IAU59_002692 [Kwoniella sp. CBS 9459]
MDTYISSSSPLFTYSPCKACNASIGFATGEQFIGRSSNGTDSGMMTYAGGSKVAINCTGTGLIFDLSYARSNGSAFKPSILINNTSPNFIDGATSDATSITNLPMGHHTFELTLNTSSAAAAPSGSTSTSTTNSVLSRDNWVRVNGATCVSGTKVGKDTKHGTIDDSAWRDWKITLSPGWNMIEAGESNFFDADQYRAELPTTSRDWNNSISWTEQAGASNEVQFTGSAAWVYGIVGGQAGTYEVKLDDVSQGIFNATAGERVYDQLLYQATNLVIGPHTISLINLEQDNRLSFDRLVAMSGLELVNPPAAPKPSQPSQSISQVPVATYYPTSSPNAASDDNASTTTILTGGAIAGITVAGILVLVFILSVVGFTLHRRRQEELVDREGSGGRGGMTEKPNQTTFWRFSSRSTLPEKSHPFQPLASPAIPLTATTATTTGSGSGFGAQQPPVPDKPPFFYHFQSSSAKQKQEHVRSGSNTHNAEAHPASSGSGAESGTGTGQSFLKISGKKAHHRKTSLSYKKGQNGHGLIISKPLPDDDNGPSSGDYTNVPLGTSTSVATSFSPSTYNEAQSSTPTGTFGNIEPMPPLPTQHQKGKSKDKEEGKDNSTSPSTSNGLPGRPLLQPRQSTLDPLSAALSGNVSSPLAELSRTTSVIRNSAHPHGYGYGAGKNANTNTHSKTDSHMNRISRIFGRRKGSVAGSLDTRKWEVETDFGTEAAFDDTEGEPAASRRKDDDDGVRDSGGEGILSMYAKFPPGPITPHTSTLEPQLASAAQQPRSSSSQSQGQNPGQKPLSQSLRDKDIVGLALGSPMEDSPDPWGEQVRQKKRKTQEEEERKMRAKHMDVRQQQEQAEREKERESQMVDILPDEEDLQPPTRRFFGKAFRRPMSGTSARSAKSASSVGSGGRYM